RSSGGFYIYTNSGLTSGMYLSSGGSSWNGLSDRNQKENLQPVDTQALLEKLAAIPISTWNYKAQDENIRHIGPMAQDFNALLPDLGGEGETYINSLDADGVALAAIQALYRQNQEQSTRIDQLEQENTELRLQLSDLAARLAALEAASVSGGER
ncbi:MAG TPA: peptidase S74, partial [Caldilineae bacterium]|nr:peptidase S74 [Caldilineae bacterium]